MKVKKGDKVQIHYTGKLEDGSSFDSSLNREPLMTTIGAGQLIAGFDSAVLDMTVGEKKSIHIPFLDAYGPHRPEMVMEVEKSLFPEGVEPQIGMQFQVDTPEYPMTVKVVEIKDAKVVLDANHFLAGKDLYFDIELVAIL
ncbi:MAG TPA: peptidylprolyl isomerase [Spirochaetia bacterium]|nr:MAG: peptidylprolyl isomerase [Spirochaetes bacterium GWB1_36_13]HCL55452.1 peptidylprolyl isomerase [Spirochaetia bacterium]